MYKILHHVFWSTRHLWLHYGDSLCEKRNGLTAVKFCKLQKIRFAIDFTYGYLQQCTSVDCKSLGKKSITYTD